MLEIKNNKIYTYTEYNEGFVSSARQMGGKWERSENAWVFPLDIKKDVENLLYDFYGYGDEKINIKLKFKNDVVGDCDGKSFVMLGKTLLRRPRRDWGVQVHKDVSIISGGFYDRGGSIRDPQIGEHIDNTILLIRNVPKSKLFEINNKYYDYEIVEGEKSKYSDYTIEQLNLMMKEIKEEIDSRV